MYVCMCDCISTNFPRVAFSSQSHHLITSMYVDIFYKLQQMWRTIFILKRRIIGNINSAAISGWKEVATATTTASNYRRRYQNYQMQSHVNTVRRVHKYSILYVCMYVMWIYVYALAACCNTFNKNFLPLCFYIEFVFSFKCTEFCCKYILMFIYTLTNTCCMLLLVFVKKRRVRFSLK